jgi:hypothetical protein
MFFEGTHEYRDYNRGGTEKRENHCAVRWINAHAPSLERAIEAELFNKLCKEAPNHSPTISMKLLLAVKGTTCQQ